MTEGVVILGPVFGLETATIMGPCVLGHPADGRKDEPLMLGNGVVIRAFAVLYQAVSIGARSHVGHGALIREDNVIGADCSIGSGAHLEPGNRIGARTRIHSGGFLASTKLGSDVFCGPRVVFTDDPHPPCPRYRDCVGGATVEDGATIGANVTVLPGITVGRGSLVGAGSVVTKSVGQGDVVIGNPARCVGRRDQLACGAGLFDRAYVWTEKRPDGPKSGGPAESGATEHP
ncbi:MAG: hypothetical protein QOK39_1754 [Acidimicrobiaceae bacterium]|jgi:acetyltransferase-like isoleucine patch superfamily enzyme|nr:hypothetical protein [Acidimicrobiaceae bacterium]